MAGDKSDSAPGARGDEPREPGAFCVQKRPVVVVFHAAADTSANALRAAELLSGGCRGRDST